MTRNLVNSGEVRRELGVSRRLLDYFLETRPTLEPKVRVSGRRFFSPAEVRAIRRALAARSAARVSKIGTRPRRGAA